MDIVSLELYYYYAIIILGIIANKYGFLFFPLSFTNTNRNMERRRGALNVRISDQLDLSKPPIYS